MTPREAKDLLMRFNQGGDIIERREDGGVFIALGAAVDAVREAYRLGSLPTAVPPRE